MRPPAGAAIPSPTCSLAGAAEPGGEEATVDTGAAISAGLPAVGSADRLGGAVEELTPAFAGWASTFRPSASVDSDWVGAGTAGEESTADIGTGTSAGTSLVGSADRMGGRTEKLSLAFVGRASTFRPLAIAESEGVAVGRHAASIELSPSIGISTKCQARVAGASRRKVSAQVDQLSRPGDSPPAGSRCINASSRVRVVGVSRCRAMAAIIRWPCGPQARAGAMFCASASAHAKTAMDFPLVLKSPISTDALRATYRRGSTNEGKFQCDGAPQNAACLEVRLQCTHAIFCCGDGLLALHNPDPSLWRAFPVSRSRVFRTTSPGTTMVARGHSQATHMKAHFVRAPHLFKISRTLRLNAAFMFCVAAFA
jgi:hypothetical protein